MSVKSPKARYAFRKIRTRKKIFGTAERPRLSVFRSSKHIYAQLVDDAAGHTLLFVSSLDPDLKKDIKKGATVAAAHAVGKAVGERAKAKKFEKVIFDRGGCTYHGRVKALAEGAREAGLQF